MIDGGMFANNPTICAMVEAYRLYGSTNFTIVSIGTGIEPVKADFSGAGHWGDIQWLAPVISILTTSNSQTVCVQTNEILGDPHWRLDISLTTPTRMKSSAILIGDWISHSQRLRLKAIL